MKKGFTTFLSALKANTPPCKKGLPSLRFLSLFLILFLGIGQMWATSYIPGTKKTVTANETIDYATIAGANATTSGKWIVNPRGGTTSSRKYTNLTSDTKGNPDSIVDNIATITSNVNMATIQVPSTAKYNQNGKYVIHMRITGITGIIAHGVTGSSGRGCAIYGQEYSTSLTENTEYGSALASMTRSGNSGSFLLQYTGFTASKEYLITIAATGGDDQLYAIELIAGAATKYTVTYKAGDGTGDDVVDSDAKTVKAFADCSFTAPSGYEFKEWQDGSSNVVAAGATVSADMTLTAIYRLIPTKYTVTYNLNGASGDAPTETSKAEGDAFNLAAAPSWAGHAFDGWSDGTTTYAAGDTYTMGAAAVTFTAQWKAVPTVLFHYQQSNLSGNLAAGTYSALGGTLTTSASMNKESASYNSSVPSDLRGGANVSKLGSTSNYIQITLATGNFVEGDTIYICGYKPYKISTTTDLSGDIVNSLTTGTAKGDYNIGYIVLPVGVEQNTIYLSRAEGTGTGFAAIKVIRPAQKEILSTEVSLSAVAVNAEAISAENLATLKTDPYKLDLTSEYAEAPTVAFTKQTIITYEDATTKTTTEEINDVAKKVDGKWQAEAEINAIIYTVTVLIPATYTVTYALNGGTGTLPTQAALVAGEKFTVADIDGITIPDGKAFAGWSDGTTTYAAGSEYTMPASDVTLTAQWIDDNNVARIGDTYYTNLDDAVAYANENADAEIILLKDIDRADRITLTKSTTINLNGNKLSKTDGGWLIFVKEGATLTINGETENSAVHGGISLGAMTNNNGSLVINGGTYTCADGVACVHVNGTCLESNVTIIGASLTSPDIAVQLNGKGTYTITNATITGATGVYIKSGELTVTNSTITGTKDPADYAYTGNGANATGDAIVVDACDYPGGAPTLNIISGTFEGTKGAVGNYNYNGTSAPAIGGIQGGTFNTEVPADLCADGYIPVKNGENNYGVTKNAKTFSLEDLVTTQDTEADYKEYLNNLGWSVANANALDNLNTGKDYDNYPYLGLKFKSAAGYVEGVVEGNKLLTIQLGHMAADADLYENGTKKVSLSGKDAETAAVHYYYVENQSTVKLQMTNDGTCVLKAITVADPYTVTFNANGGDAIEPMQGKPYITLPEPTNGTMNFKGWYDAETGGNLIGEAGASYTPTGNIELHAQWEAQSTINTLSDLKVNGETVLGFAANEHTYRMVLPYKSALPMITSAIPTNANATFALLPEDGPKWTDEYDGGCYRQQVIVTPQDPTAEKGYYDIRITYAPKDGVSIIKVATTGGTNKTVTGLYAGEGDVNLSSSKKMDGGKYIGFTLDGTTLQTGDRINVHTTTASTSGGSHIIFYDNMTDKTELYDTEEIGGVGNNIFTINAAMVGNATAYVYRSDADAVHKWNGYIDYIEVTRPMNPMLTAITFDGEPGVIDEAKNEVTVELPFSSDVESMIVEPTIAWNAAAATNAIVVNDGSGWVIGDNTYVLTDKDGDQTTYTITLTKAAASADATLATLAYNGTNITLVPDQYTYDIELPKGTVDVPTVTYTTNHTGATADMTDATVLPGATTIKVTAEDGTTQQNYTINFTVSTSDIITIFDGSTMSNIATSPSGAISWEIVGSTMGAGDKNISYNDVTYTRALSCDNSSATKHLKIVVADNNKAQFEIIGMSNSSSDTRHAWLTNSTDKGEFANAIAGLTSNGYNPAKFTTDWLEEGTYYLHSDNTVAILLIRVKAEPVPAKCEAPTISGLADVAVCDLSSALLDGTATVSDGGTVTYKWYAEGDAETVLATTATYAPTTVGNYYVVATNSLADHRDNSTISSVVVVRIKTAPVITTEVLDQHAEAGNNVTLSVVATDAESYQWYTCDDAAGTNPEEVVGATNASLEVAVTSSMSQYYKVIISNTCGSAESIGKVEEWTELPQANVTESITWDWTVAAMDEVKTADGNVEYLMANVSSAVPNNENFRSDMLLITAQYANRNATNQFFQGWQIRFYTEVPGKVSLNCRAIHGTMSITINGTVIDDAKGSDMGTATTPFFVPAGWVTIVFDNQSSGYEGEAARVQKIVFNATPDYTRDVTEGRYGTICLPNGGVMVGASLFGLSYYNEAQGLLYMDEADDATMVAGIPYVFLPSDGVHQIKVYYTDEENAAANTVNGLVGYLDNEDMQLPGDATNYILKDNKIKKVVGGNNSNVFVTKNRAYIQLGSVDKNEPARVPGRRRVAIGQAPQVATGMENVDASAQPVKMIINGQLFILRGEKMYDAQGKLVK